MALIVEDGAVVSGADSFLSIADARAMASDYGLSLPDDDDEAGVILRQGYLNLLASEKTLQGLRVSADQTGIFPRSGVYLNGFNVPSDAIPNEVKLAQMYGSDAINSGASINSVDTGESLASFDVKGVYSETYQANSSKSTNATIQGVYNALHPLTKAAIGGGGIGLSRDCVGYL